MENDDLDRLAELADAATPGPWELGDGWVYTDPIYEDDSRLANVAVMSKFADAQRQAEEHTRIEANLAFIAACSPSVVSALVQRTRDAEFRAEVQAGSLAQAARELAELKQAMWDGWAILGFDTDGDTGPGAMIAGMGLSGWVQSWLRDIRQARLDADEGEQEQSDAADHYCARESALRDAVTQLADRAVFADFTHHDHFDPAAGEDVVLAVRESDLRALTATSSPSADAHADLFGVSVTDAIQDSSPDGCSMCPAPDESRLSRESTDKAVARADAAEARLAELEATNHTLRQQVTKTAGRESALQANATYWRTYADERRAEIDRLVADRDRWEMDAAGWADEANALRAEQNTLRSERDEWRRVATAQTRMERDRAEAAEAVIASQSKALQAAEAERDRLRDGITALAGEVEAEAISEGYEESHWANQARALLNPPTTGETT